MRIKNQGDKGTTVKSAVKSALSPCSCQTFNLLLGCNSNYSWMFCYAPCIVCVAKPPVIQAVFFFSSAA